MRVFLPVLRLSTWLHGADALHFAACLMGVAGLVVGFHALGLILSRDIFSGFLYGCTAWLCAGVSNLLLDEWRRRTQRSPDEPTQPL